MAVAIVSAVLIFDLALLLFVGISLIPAMLIEKRPGWPRFLCDNALACTVAIGFGVWAQSTDLQVAGVDLFYINLFGFFLALLSIGAVGAAIAEHVSDVRRGEVPKRPKWRGRLTPEETRLGFKFSGIILVCTFAALYAGKAMIDAAVMAGRLTPAERRGTTAIFQGQFAVLFALGATLLIFYVMTRGRLPIRGLSSPQWSARGVLGRVSEATDEFASSVSKARLFIRGIVFLVQAVVYWRVGSWWWSNYVTSGTVFEVIGYVIYGAAVVCAGKAAFELLMALKNSDPPKAGAKLGNAKVADSEAAQTATQGRGDVPPWAGHGYRD